MIKYRENKTTMSDNIGIRGLAGSFLIANIAFFMFWYKVFFNEFSKKSFYVVMFLSMSAVYLEILLYFHVMEFGVNYRMMFIGLLVLGIICFVGRDWIPYWVEENNEELI